MSPLTKRFSFKKALLSLTGFAEPKPKTEKRKEKTDSKQTLLILTNATTHTLLYYILAMIHPLLSLITIPSFLITTPIILQRNQVEQK